MPGGGWERLRVGEIHVFKSVGACKKQDGGARGQDVIFTRAGEYFVRD